MRNVSAKERIDKRANEIWGTKARRGGGGGDGDNGDRNQQRPPSREGRQKSALPSGYQS
jgi:hypothetical protein